MALGTQPSKLPEWASQDVVSPAPPAGDGLNNVIEPSSTKKQEGWDFKEKPPRQWWNWVGRFSYLWLKWFSEFIVYAQEVGVWHVTIQPDDDSAGIRLRGGPGQTDSGGLIEVKAGDGAAANWGGGAVDVKGGDGYGNGNGGNVVVAGGSGAGTGDDGRTDLQGKIDIPHFAMIWDNTTQPLSATDWSQVAFGTDGVEDGFCNADKDNDRIQLTEQGVYEVHGHVVMLNNTGTGHPMEMKVSASSGTVWDFLDNTHYLPANEPITIPVGGYINVSAAGELKMFIRRSAVAAHNVNVTRAVITAKRLHDYKS